jgi:hypothetical protein
MPRRVTEYRRQESEFSNQGDLFGEAYSVLGFLLYFLQLPPDVLFDIFLGLS